MSDTLQESKPAADAAGDEETMGRRLASRRALKGLTQLQVAEGVGVAQGTISRLEDDAFSPTIDLLTKVADFYGLSLDYLVKGKAA